MHRPWAVGVAAGHAQGLGREGQRVVEIVEEGGHLRNRRGQGECAPDGGAHREPGEVPAGVLAELTSPEVLAEQSAQQVEVRRHHRADLAEPRRWGHGVAPECGGQVPEEPGAAETAPADDDPVAPGGRGHGQGVRGLPQVSVAQDRDGGDRLLQAPDRLPVGRTRVQLLGGAGTVPVTVKLRIGVDADHVTYLESGRTAEDEGAAAVTLHARTAEQLYSGAADWQAIGRLKEAVTTIPVLGNGDLWEASDALAMTAATGCDGVVVGRGCLGRPWLFRDLAAAFRGDTVPPPPGLGEICTMMSTHLDLLCGLFGEDLGARQFRKHTGWYLTGFPVGSAVRRALALASTVAEVTTLLDDLDHTLAFPPEALRMARGHTNGPRPVHLPDRWLDSVDDPTPPVGGGPRWSGPTGSSAPTWFR